MHSPSASPKGELSHMSDASVLISGASVFTAAAQGMPFHYQALEVRRSCIPVSKGAVTIRKTVLGRLPPPRYYTDS